MWNKYAIPLALVLALGSIGFALYEKMSTPHIAYVRIKDVFEGFDMKKEMEAKYVRENTSTQHALDSMALLLQVQSTSLQATVSPEPEAVNRFQLCRNSYFSQQQQAGTDQQSRLSTYNSQITTRMMQYVREYGKANGYTCILGDDGNGSLMYAGDAIDLTIPVIRYLNERYSGQKK